MREHTTKVYQYSELSDDAKAKARDWYREASAGDMYPAEGVTDDFKDVLKACGFELETQRKHDALYWSGFGSQGDGACFAARWRASFVSVDAMIKDRPEVWTHLGQVTHSKGNARLVSLLKLAASLAAQHPTGWGDIVANDRYMSTRCDRAMIENAGGDEVDEEELQTDLDQLARDLAHYFYASLEAEYEYANSDEAVTENIEANEYEFTEEGARYC